MDVRERVQDLLIAYQAGRLEAILRMVAPDVRIAPLTTELEPGPDYEGPEGVARWVRELAESDRDYQPAVTGIEVHDRRVLVTGCVYAASAAGELESKEAAWVFAFDDDDLLAWMRAYTDTDAARAAARHGDPAAP